MAQKAFIAKSGNLDEIPGQLGIRRKFFFNKKWLYDISVNLTLPAIGLTKQN